jgi:hypothetical protein
LERSLEKYIGMKFGKRTVLEYLPEKNRHTFLCRCECGKLANVQLASLKLGKSISCNSCAMKVRNKDYENIVGKYINEWFIISETEEITKCHNKIFNVKCKCGQLLKKSKAHIKNTRSCQKCARKIVGYNKKMNFTRRYIGKTLGKWKIIDRIQEGEKFNFIGICPCGTIKKAEDIGTFKKSTGCKKCCPKNNSAGLKNFFLESAKKLVGTSNLYFKILKVLKSEKGNIWFLCKCLSCKKQLTLRSAQISSNTSCGCARVKSLPRGSRHHFSKISEIEASSIRDLYKSGYYTKKEICEQFNLSKTHIMTIINNKSWKHV